MLPSIAQTGQMNMSVNGRNYKQALGNFVDVLDMDAATLCANGWVRVCLSGPTASRPSTNPNLTPPYTASNGMIYFDTTLSAPWFMTARIGGRSQAWSRRSKSALLIHTQRKIRCPSF